LFRARRGVFPELAKCVGRITRGFDFIVNEMLADRDDRFGGRRFGVDLQNQRDLPAVGGFQLG